MSTTTTRTRTAVDERALPLLEALAHSPELSQRELAQQTGLSLTRAHFLLRGLIEHGLVQVRGRGDGGHRQGYAYELTAAGHELLTRLTYRALSSAVEGFWAVRERFRATLARLVGAGVEEIGLLGEGPLCDAVRDLLAGEARLSEIALEQAAVVLVCDPEAVSDYRGAGRLVRLAARPAMP